MRPRHSDADLLELARDGSAPAFASLLHRHRDVLQRAALRAEHPERVVESAMVAAVRDLRRGRARADDLRAWLGTHVESLVDGDPGRPGVERLLPVDWFDRTWVRVERRWPSGRRPVSLPRWAGLLAAAAALALTGSATTYLLITADRSPEVLSELVAEPIEDPDVLVVPGPVVDSEPEDAPELFGDIELGELPPYDLGGSDGDRGPEAPTVGPPAAPAPDASGPAQSDGGADGGPDTD